MMGRSPRCYIPSFVKISPPVLEKKIFEGVFTIYGRVSEEKMFENVNDGRTLDPWVSYKLTGEPLAQVS